MCWGLSRRRKLESILPELQEVSKEAQFVAIGAVKGIKVSSDALKTAVDSTFRAKTGDSGAGVHMLWEMKLLGERVISEAADLLEREKSLFTIKAAERLATRGIPQSWQNYQTV